MRTVPILALDTETTGLNTSLARVWEIGFASTRETTIACATALINPGIPIPQENIELSHIDPILLEKIGKSQSFPEKYEKLVEKCQFDDEGLYLTYNGLDYDMPLLDAECDRYNLPRLPPNAENTIDAIVFIRESLPKVHPKTLGNVAEFFGIPAPCAHRAWADAKTTIQVFQKFQCKLPGEPHEAIALQKRIKAAQDADRAMYSYWLRRKGGKLFMNCGKHSGKPVEQVDRGYWSWMLKTQRAYEIEMANPHPVDWTGPVDKKGRKMEPFPDAVLDVASFLMRTSTAKKSY